MSKEERNSLNLALGCLMLGFLLLLLSTAGCSHKSVKTDNSTLNNSKVIEKNQTVSDDNPVGMYGREIISVSK